MVASPAIIVIVAMIVSAVSAVVCDFQSCHAPAVPHHQTTTVCRGVGVEITSSVITILIFAVSSAATPTIMSVSRRSAFVVMQVTTTISRVVPFSGVVPVVILA